MCRGVQKSECDLPFGRWVIWLAGVTASLFLLIADPVPAAAGACSNVQPTPGVYGYQQRREPDRCEGLYVSPVAGEELEFLSLVLGKVRYNVGSDKTLVVGVPDVGPLQATQVFVEARALPSGTYYRMDTTVESKGSFRWPLATVIEPVELLPDTIGVVGWVSRGPVKVFVPVSVSVDSTSTTSRQSPEMILRSSADIERLQWRSWPEDGSAQPTAWQTVEHDKVRAIHASEPIRVVLSSKSSKVQMVEIAAMKANSNRPIKMQIRAFIP
jgi:hypothetical protein